MSFDKTVKLIKYSSDILLFTLDLNIGKFDF